MFANGTFNFVKVSRYFRIRGSDQLSHFSQAQAWTPQIANGITSLTNNGSYYQIFGNMVSIRANLTIVINNQLTCAINNLPVEPDLTTQFYQANNFLTYNAGTKSQFVRTLINNATDIVMTYRIPDIDPVPVTADIDISMFYQVKN